MSEPRTMTAAQLAVIAMAIAMGCPDPIDAERLVLERLKLVGRVNITDRLVAQILAELETIAAEQTAPPTGSLPEVTDS